MWKRKIKNHPIKKLKRNKFSRAPVWHTLLKAIMTSEKNPITRSNDY